MITEIIGFLILILLLCLVAIPIWFCIYLTNEVEKQYETDLEVMGEIYARPLRELLNDDSRSDV